MATLLDVFGEWILNHYAWRHFIIALGVLVQGEVTMLVGTFLVLKGYLGWGGFLLALALGMFGYEIFLYALGRKLKDTPLGLRLEAKVPQREKILNQLQDNMSKILIVSRFIMYVNLGAVFLSGWTKMRFLKFIGNRIIANTLWFSIGIGGSLLVFGGMSLLRLRQIEFSVALILILIFTVNFLLRKKFRKNLFKSKKGGSFPDS